MADIATLGIKIDASSAESAAQKLGRFQQQASTTESAVSRLTSTLSALAAGFSLREVARASDTFQTLNAQLKISTGSAEAAARAYGEVFRIAQSSGQALDEVANVYRRLSDVSGDIGISQEQVARTTESVAQAIALSGGSAAGAQAALTQFGQGLASGTLRGEELNSVLEQAPRLARALAEGLGIPIGKLRELAATGAITSQAIIDALNKQSGVLQNEFGQLPITLGRAFTNLQNAFINTVGSFEKSTGLFRGFAEAVVVLADNFKLVATAASAVAAVYGGRLVAGLTAAAVAKVSASNEARRLAAAELAAAQAAVANVQAMTAATLSTNGLAAASARLAAAQASVASASRGAALLGLLGGPIGAITTALTLGATAWTVWGDKAETAAQKAGRSIDAALDRIKKLKAESQFGTGDVGALNEALDQIDARIKLLSQSRSPAARDEVSRLSAQRAEIEKTLNDIETGGISARQKANARYADYVGERKSLGEQLNDALKVEAQAFEEATKDVQKGSVQYVNALEAYNRKVAEIRQKFAKKAGTADNSDAKRQQELRLLAAEQVLGTDDAQLKFNSDVARAYEEFDRRRAAANDEAIRQANAQEDAIASLAERYRDLADPTRQYRQEIELVTALEAQGRLTAEEAFNARGRLLEQEQSAAEKVSDSLKKQKSLTEELGLTFTSAFEDAIVSGKKLGDVLAGLAQDILRVVVRKNITEPLGTAIGDFAKTLFSANGNAFAGAGPVQAFAAGGAFGNGEVLTRPTLFRFASGGSFRAGVAGEAGPEGALPLKRMGNGKLGVYAEGGGGQTVLNVRVINNAGAEVQVAQNNEGGLDVLIDQIDAAMADRIGSGRGATSAAMQGRYGLRPAVGGY